MVTQFQPWQLERNSHTKSSYIDNTVVNKIPLQIFQFGLFKSTLEIMLDVSMILLITVLRCIIQYVKQRLPNLAKIDCIEQRIAHG